MDADQRHRRSLLAVNLGLMANVSLAALKTSIGVLGHSPALLADGINSTSDVAYYLVVSVFMRLSRKPPDVEHPFGHTQLESIAALVVGSFVVTTAVAVFWDAVNKVFDLLVGQGDFQGAALIALWVALFTVVSKIGLTFFTQKIGRETSNYAIMALGHDHRNDIFSALAAAVGIFLGRMGYPWVDPLAGALVSLVILSTGIQILRQSSADLMDSVPNQDLEQQIKRLLRDLPAVKQIEQVYSHRFGPYLTITLTIGIDGSLSVAEGDEIASRVEKILRRNIEFLRFVNIHYHPSGSAQ